jgi:hypothetical protein
VRVAYCTGGTVGAGHFVRGVAIARALERAGFDGTFGMFGPPLDFPVVRASSDYRPVAIRDDHWLRDRGLAAGSELAQKLTAFAPDLVLVDLFWAPLRWVLPLLGCEAWLLLRLAPPVWFTGRRDLPFERDRYTRIVAIEPVEDHGLGATRIDPVVVANPDEVRPSGALREWLGADAGETLTVIAHAGERGELAALRAEAGAGAAVLDLYEPGAPFPAAEWLPGADLVVCGAGYNAFWEARWLGYACRSRFVPFPRTIDDQARRLLTLDDAAPRANGADVLARWIAG